MTLSPAGGGPGGESDHVDSCCAGCPDSLGPSDGAAGGSSHRRDGYDVGSVIKKRRKRMAKKKHRKLLKKTRVQRRRLGK